MLFVATRARIVCGKKPALAEAIVQLTQISRTSDDVVVRIIGIRTKTVACLQLRPCAGHDLHQAHRAFRRQCADIAEALCAHDRPNPGRWDRKPPRCFGHRFRDPIGSNSSNDWKSCGWFGVRGPGAAEQGDD